MKFATVCLALVVFAAFCNAQSDIYAFDCHRPPTQCQNGGVCQADNSCDCTGTSHTGPDCRLTATACTNAALTCKDTADNAGTCFQTSDATPVDRCECAAGYISRPSATTAENDCKAKRVSATCSGTSMTVSFSPYGARPFTGMVNLIPDPADTGLSNYCALPVTAPDADGVFNWDIAYDAATTKPPGACATSGLNFVDQSASPPVKYRLFIQYHPNVQASTDTIVTFECTPTVDGSTVDATVSYTTTVVDIATGLTQNVVTNGGTLDLSGTLNKGTTPLLATDVNAVGTELNLDALKTIAGTSFSYWSIWTLTAHSDNTAAPADSMNLITDGCIVAGGIIRKSVDTMRTVAHPTTSAVSSRIRIYMLLWKFQSTVEVYLKITYKVCTLRATCTPTACTDVNKQAFVADDGAAKRRRRRAAGDQDWVDDGGEIPMNFTIRVLDYSSYGKTKWTGDGSDINNMASCIQSVVFIVPLILLVVLVVVSMAIAVYFFTKLNRRKSKEDGMTNMAYKS